MRHGRKSRNLRVDGYKRHVLHDLDTDLIRAVGITPANAPEASVTREISEDLDRQEVCLKELYIDRAYLVAVWCRNAARNWSYEEALKRVADSLVVRWFCLKPRRGPSHEISVAHW
jgi:hypothetical protein